MKEDYMSPSFWQIAVVLVIVVVLFGGKRLRNLGGDLGSSLKGFKKAMKEEEQTTIEHKDSDIDITAKKVDSKANETNKQP